MPPEVFATTILNLIEGHAIHCAIQGVSPLANEQRLYVRYLMRQLNILGGFARQKRGGGRSKAASAKKKAGDEPSAED